MAAAIHQDHGVAHRDGWDLIAPIVAVGEAAVEEDDGRGLAVDHVVEIVAGPIEAAHYLAQYFEKYCRFTRATRARSK
jgi:hypothetical protein